MIALIRRRRWSGALLGLAALTAVVLLGARLYLSSPAAARILQGALEEQLNTRAELASARIGLFGQTTASGLRLYEPGEEQPYLEAAGASLDISAWIALWGRRAPRRLELAGVKLRLRFDRDGNLLTKLPELAPSDAPTPRATVAADALTIDQQGRKPFTIHNILLRLTPGDAANLSGAIDDPTWGPIRVGGHFADGRLVLDLASDGVKLTMPMLRSLPFVPPALWDTLQAEGGRVPATFRLSIDPAAKEKVRYRVTFDEALVRLPQPDRPAMAVSPAGGTLEGGDTGFAFAGTIRDPYWGNWAVTARQVNADKTLTVELSTPDTAVDQKKLEALPYVPKNVWKQVAAEGRTSAKVRVRLFSDKSDVLYRVELRPRDVAVRVAAIDLKATSALGEVIVEDGQVFLNGVRGEVAGGRLETAATMDFRGADSVLKFDLTTQGVQLQKLPVKKWGLPPVVEGRLNAKASITVTVKEDGRLVLGGTGQGVINQVKVAGFPAAPIPLVLNSDGRRFNFKTGPGVLKSLLLVSLVAAQPADGEPPALPRPDQLADTVATAVAGLARGVADGASATIRQAARLARGRQPNEPVTYLDARIALTDVDVAELLKRLEVPLPITLAGRLSVTVQLGVPINDAASLRLYRFTGTAASPRLSVAGVELRQLEARVDYADGVLRLRSLRGAVPRGKGQPPGAFTGTGRVAVVPSGAASIDAQVMRLPVDLLGRVAPAVGKGLSGELSGRVRASAPLKSLGQPESWRGVANVQSSRLDAYGVPLRDISATATATAGVVRVTGLRATAFGGAVTGGGVVPLGDEAGSVDLKIDGLDAAALLKAVAAPGLKVQGHVSGTAKGTFRLPAGGTSASFDGNVDVTAGKLRVQGVAARRLTGKLQFRDGKGQYSVEGEALGGKVSVEGKFPPPPRGSVGEPHGRLRINRVFLGRLARELGLGEQAQRLRGVVTLDLPFRFDGPDRSPVGRGRFLVRNLRWQGSDLSDDLGGDLTVSADGLSLRDAGGQLAGGLLRLRGAVRFRESRGWFVLSLSGAELGRLAAFDRDFAAASKGGLDVNLRGSLAGGEWRASGAALLRRGQVGGVVLTDARVPVEVTLAAARGYGELAVRDAAAQVGTGRARLEAKLAWGDTLRLDGSLRLIDANVGSLAGAFGDISSYARGRVTGRADFSSRDLRALNDLSAEVQATLKETQALQLPVLSLLVPYLAPGRGALTFQEGELRARLGGGILRLNTLSLASPFVQLMMSGTVTVQGGRLDLDAVARTSRLPVDPVAFRLIARRVPAIGPVPLAVIVRATELLSNRVVYLRISGTARAPAVRVEPLRQLQEEAVRFFFRRALPLAPAP